MLSYLLGYRDGKTSSTDHGEVGKEQSATSECTLSTPSASTKNSTTANGGKSPKSLSHQSGSCPLQLSVADAAAAARTIQQCSPTPALSKANTPSPEPFARRPLGVAGDDGDCCMENARVTADDLTKENGTECDVTSKSSERRPLRARSNNTVGTSLMGEIFGEGTKPSSVPSKEDDDVSDGDSDFFDAAEISFLGEEGAEDGNSTATDVGNESTTIADFQSCVSRSKITVPCGSMHNGNDNSVVAFVEESIPAQIDRSQCDVSVLSSASAVTFHTAICGDDNVICNDDNDDSESDAASFRTAASQLSSHTKATQATANTYATALSRINSKLDKTYVLMPKRLINAGHVNESMSVLQDSRYISQRVRKLGAALSAELMVADCDLLLEAAAASHRTDRKSRQLGRLSAESAIAAKMIVIFDRFRRIVCDGTLDALISSSERGMALFVLGVALNRRNIVAKSVAYYRSALTFFFAGIAPTCTSSSSEISYTNMADAAEEDFDSTDNRFEVTEGSMNYVGNNSRGRLNDHVMIARTLVHLADHHEKKKQDAEAKNAFKAAARHFERAISMNSKEVEASVGQGDTVGARVFSRRMKETKLEWLFVLARLGGIHRRTKHFDEVIECFEAIVSEAELEKGCEIISSPCGVLAKLARISCKQTRKLTEASSANKAKD